MAGALLAGGHANEDDEPKVALFVNGVVNPKQYWVNSGTKLGDALLLSKAIGSGTLFNANIKGWVSHCAIKECLSTIITLNKRVAEIMAGSEIHAGTDITGFGLVVILLR